MRPARLRWLTSLAVALMLAAAGPGVRAQDPAGGAVCALFTPEEVGKALGTEVEAEAESDEWSSTCTWSPIDPDSYAYLDVEWASGTPDEIRGAYPDLVEVTLGTRPAWYDFGLLLIALDSGVLTLHGAPEDGDDRAALTGLGELAVTRSAFLPPPPVIGPSPYETDAPDRVTDAFCALFTPEEIGDILGTDVEAVPGPIGCTWSATTSGVPRTATAGWTGLSLADQKAAWPDGSDLTVGGRPAYYSPGLFLDELLIEVDAGVLWLVVTGYDGDVGTALTQLGELAVPRSGSLPPPPPPGPVPSVAADAALGWGWVAYAEEPALTENRTALP